MIKTVVCKHCDGEFTYNQTNRSRRWVCDECRIAKRKATAAAFELKYAADGRKRRRNIAHRYNLTPAQVDELMQQTHCQACGEPPRKTGAPAETNLHVDHDHATNVVRGVLCHSCNLALGHSRDSVDRLRALADYLEDFLRQ